MSGIKGANAGEKCARYVHGETKTRLHKIWESMIARCEYEKHPYSCGAKMDGDEVKMEG